MGPQSTRDGLEGITLGMTSLCFDLLDCRDDFPAFAERVAARRPRLGVLEPAPGLVALRTSAAGPRRRVEWLRMCDAPFALAAGWWALSLPAGVVVHGARRPLPTPR
jgi:hypothetical protein